MAKATEYNVTVNVPINADDETRKKLRNLINSFEDDVADLSAKAGVHLSLETFKHEASGAFETEGYDSDLSDSDLPEEEQELTEDQRRINAIAQDIENVTRHILSVAGVSSMNTKDIQEALSKLYPDSADFVYRMFGNGETDAGFEFNSDEDTDELCPPAANTDEKKALWNFYINYVRAQSIMLIAWTLTNCDIFRIAAKLQSRAIYMSDLVDYVDDMLLDAGIDALVTVDTIARAITSINTNFGLGLTTLSVNRPEHEPAPDLTFIETGVVKTKLSVIKR